ncbi:MAG: type IV secretion system DNA-binding domain-containing protein, partial [Bacteroidales bacterium]|nr:type IV secretion system DNA-binding domain-containing protein [Bacteroidales bacterium]
MKIFPTIKNCIAGSVLTDNIPMVVENEFISINGTCSSGKKSSNLSLDENMLHRGIMLEGATGTGKTETALKIVRQIRNNLEVPYSMIIVDVKNDYQGCLFRTDDKILGQGEFRDTSERWNIFKDILIDGWDDWIVELNAYEFVQWLFKDHKNETQPFWTNAAQLLLYCTIITLIKRSRNSLRARKALTNKGLRDFFAQFSPEQYVKLMEDCSEPGTVRMLLGNDIDNLQALGVIGEAVTTVLTLFVDVFGDEGDFSIRSFVRNKNNQAIFLKYDPAYKETQQKLFGLLVNLMLKEVLSYGNTEGNVVFLCDELPSIGKVDLASAINMGRAKGFICMAGFQSIEQVYSVYGEVEGNALLAGFCTKLLFAPNDIRTRKYIQDLFGGNLVEYITLSPGGSITRKQNGHVIEDYDMNSLDTGDCICSLIGQQ